jgi:hypothetical protein
MAGKNSRPNGKGDQPRKVNGPKYRDNYDNIKWRKSPKPNEPTKTAK